METIDPDQPVPVTTASLTADLVRLGVAPGSVLVVHSSLSSIGYVSGGAHAVVLALREVLGPGGTLVVPTHSTQLSDPAPWENPPVPEAWWDTIRAMAPAYDPALTATAGMGAIPDTVRLVPGARRSAHPLYSFCAVGPDAARVTEGHTPERELGEDSPLGRLYELGADVLLLGVGHENNTSLHLAEHRSGTRPVVAQGAPVLVDGERRWVTFDELDTWSDDFEQVGAAAAVAGLETVGPVGRATARLLPQRALVDFATGWFRANRT